MRKTSTRNIAAIASAGAVAVLGLSVAGFAVMWVAGSLGISAAAASQVVAAIEVGGWALIAIGAVFSAGVISAITATVKWYIAKKTRALAIA